jgi:cytochrome c-type biogenesis protein CcmH/NrfF
VGLVVTVANTLTTRRLWSSVMFERPQKIAQTILMWLVPGTFLVVRHFLFAPRRRPTDDSSVGPLQSTFEAPEQYASHHDGGGHDGH